MTNAPRSKDWCGTGSRIHLQGIDLSISIMSAELRMYRAYASFVKRFLFIGGICPNTRRQNVVYRYIVLWILICCFITLFGVGNCCKENVTNISLLTASLNLFSTLLNVTMKVSFASLNKTVVAIDSDSNRDSNSNSNSFTSHTSVWPSGIAAYFLSTCVWYMHLLDDNKNHGRERDMYCYVVTY